MTRTVHLPEGIRAVIFDLDGLLIDTETLWVNEEAALLADHGAEYTERDHLATVGQTIDASISHFVGRIGLPESSAPALRAELIHRLQQVLIGRLEPLPGARELVGAIAKVGLPMAIASNNDRRIVVLALEAAGIADAFDVVISAEQVESAKPAPDVYLQACLALGVEPAEALALEDSEVGVAAAKAAGMHVYAVPQLAEADVGAADRVLSSLEDLLM